MARPRKELDLARVRDLRERGLSIREIAAELGNVAPMTICRALQGWESPMPLLTGVPGLVASPARPESQECGMEAVTETAGTQQTADDAAASPASPEREP